ncbi:hypothetical protein Hamer_G012589 [Homarus americanus]|uniref:Uncharacterized protein n=1 Tax=Homarus americanus TaxID=6706 RepID=A0A8J5KHU3_HOMAM|nr:hypothetical protein Hamer_G012589 [Homarus americanus]
MMSVTKGTIIPETDHLKIYLRPFLQQEVMLRSATLKLRFLQHVARTKILRKLVTTGNLKQSITQEGKIRISNSSGGHELLSRSTWRYVSRDWLSQSGSITEVTKLDLGGRRWSQYLFPGSQGTKLSLSEEARV